MNSRSHSGNPARSAIASPSPVTAGGFEVDAKTWPKPPLANTTARAVIVPTEVHPPLPSHNATLTPAT